MNLQTIRNLRSVEVAAGDVYVFIYDMETRAGHTYPRNSILRVLEATDKAPHGEIGEVGHNWVCRTDYGTSIWATLEQCVSRDLFHKLECDSSDPQSVVHAWMEYIKARYELEHENEQRKAQQRLSAKRKDLSRWYKIEESLRVEGHPEAADEIKTICEEVRRDIKKMEQDS